MSKTSDENNVGFCQHESERHSSAPISRSALWQESSAPTLLLKPSGPLGHRERGEAHARRVDLAEDLPLEDPDQREFAVSDPRGFLDQFPDGAILDEVQRAPELFSYLQTRLMRPCRRNRW